MMLVITILSVLFIGIGFVITESNAKYLLSGYNTMSEAERSNVDIKTYLPFFRNFHIFLGLSLFIIGTIIYYFVDADWSGIFMVFYPIVAYIYLIWKSSAFLKQNNKKQRRKNILGTSVLVVVLIGVSIMFLYSYQNNTITIKRDVIEISGDYGMNLKIDDIKSIELVDSLPELSMKLNGFAMQNIKKGFFKTKSGEKVKLLMNSMDAPIIYIQKKDGFKIYYTSKDKSNEEIFAALKVAMGQ